MLETLFFLFLLCSDGSSFEIRRFALLSSSQRRLRPMNANRMGIVLMATPSDDETYRNSTAREDRAMKGLFEGFVRSVTGETDYEFGQLGEKPPSDNETYKYRFGDITKSVISEITQPDNAQQYREKREQALQQLGIPLKADKDLPIDMLETIYSSLDKKQRINLILAGCQLGAEGLVLWGLLTNVCTMITGSLAWICSLWAFRSGTGAAPPPIIPIRMETELWRTFTAKYMGFDLVLSPIFLIARAVLMLVSFRRYHSFVDRISTNRFVVARGSVRRYNSRVLQKALAVIVAFFATNLILTGIASTLIFALIGVVFRISLY